MDRDAYVEKMKASIDDWNDQIAKVQERAEKVQAEARSQYKKQLQDLRARRDEAQARLKEAQAASDKAWEDLHSGYEAAWDNKAFQDAMSRFR